MTRSASLQQPWLLRYLVIQNRAAVTWACGLAGVALPRPPTEVTINESHTRGDILS
jgi:hypothetical protein